MKSTKVLLIGALLLLGLFRSQAAEPAAQTGGLPSLGARVDVLEVTVEDQGLVGAELVVEVDDLQSQLTAVQNDLLLLERKLPMFAVVNADGTRRASRGVLSVTQPVDSSGNPLTGHYHVTFDRNVSLCAVTATAEPSASKQITASVNGTFRGIINPNVPPEMFIIVLTDEDNNRIDVRFNVMVAC